MDFKKTFDLRKNLETFINTLILRNWKVLKIFLSLTKFSDLKNTWTLQQL